ncbi:glutaminase kidney isoform, mitochondrial-like isoform X1 [Mercenaria mercenaria]|uniref:glutaminase kidney isoform, mitochondrial-like isoform X1 n=2 Tax=Mercenaria mercenaria TaxID=6596 RepID=UPI00234E98DB|nr:glutaminase kidney isoform, mitochondrial-like isoform X1 [Mercenaria mercenaria]
MAGTGSGSGQAFRRLTRIGSITLDHPPLLNLQETLGELLLSNMEDFEDKLFDYLCDSRELLSMDKFKKILNESGLRNDDPRLKEMVENFHEVEQKQLHDEHELRGTITRETFKECVTDNIVLISRALKNQFIIPEWTSFTQHIKEMYEDCKTNTSGTPASYIPQLARVDPKYWGISVCTIDGQRYSLGDTKVPFSLQSIVKPLSYALVLNDLTPEVVHKHVGQEPSGKSFNELTLDYEHKPHNPMINAGAIVVSSLLKKEMNIADRFDYQPSIEEERKVTLNKTMGQMKRLTGGEYLGFNNSVYLSERATADRNFALGYYMRENKCFPEGVDLHEVLEFYFQLCSIEVTAESGSVIAATLANGGICPMTGEKILSAEAVRNTLSLMHSCGMYDYSGQFAFKVGLPAKSGVAGGVMLVVPNVMGIFLWSPPLDKWGNSCKGVQFCENLVAKFNFHNYDNLKHTQKKIDPRGRAMESKAQDVVNLLFSAYNGDVTAMRRYSLLGMDMSLADYDGRTALHLAAAEGHETIVKFLLEKCNVSPYVEDRWNCTPLEDARKFGHAEIAAILEKYMSSHPERDDYEMSRNMKNLSSD